VYDAAEIIFTDPNLLQHDGWPVLDEVAIMRVLQALGHSSPLTPVYVTSGKLHRIESGKLVSENHQMAEPYFWQFAHDVRPAAQSLGVKGCSDCHSTDSTFLFADTPIDSAMNGHSKSNIKMVQLQKLDHTYQKLFAFSFVFRPWLKIITMASSVLIAAILLLNFFTAFAAILKSLGRNKGN